MSCCDQVDLVIEEKPVTLEISGGQVSIDIETTVRDLEVCDTGISIDITSEQTVVAGDGDVDLEIIQEDINLEVAEILITLETTCQQGPAGPPGPPGPPGTGALPQLSLTIPASSSDNLDVIALSALTSVKWVLTIENTTSGDKESEIVVAQYRGSTVTHSEYSVIGDSTINYVVDVKIVFTNLVLEITNNETVAIEARATRIQVDS